MLAFEDSRLMDVDKLDILLANIYKRQPADAAEAVRKAMWFLNCGEDQKDERGPRLCSFAKDSKFIFAAFRQTHGIDLESESVHWWKFVALFMDLGSDTAFCNLVGLRKMDSEGKTTKEQKQMIRSMGDIFDIEQPDQRTAEESEAERKFNEALKVAQSRNNGRD